MSYLLDTHTLLWFLEDSPKISETSASIISNRESNLYISVASMWEVALKSSLGKLFIEGGVSAFWKHAEANSITVLQIREEYLSILEHIPFLHRDPFDRLLIATALVENLVIISADKNIQLYSIECIW